jgi:transposase InsO family protein
MVVSVDVRIVAAVADSGVNVAEFCRREGVSRDTFYRWRRRFLTEGLEGLTPRSTRPKSSPARTPLAIEDLVISLRKELDDQGADVGSATIQWHLGRRNDLDGRVPSQATIWRILVRRGFVIPQPRKRPKGSFVRFEAERPNQMWQTDATKWTIATGRIEILTFLDDHSRMNMNIAAVEVATTQNTWSTFRQAADRHGLPTGVLSDNGLNFSGRLRGFEVQFETNLRAAGVRPITSTPYHPQTCGKIERFHQTLKKWLTKRALAATLAELQTQLDEFTIFYNTLRPHRGIDRVTPRERFDSRPPLINPGNPLPDIQRATEVTIDARGLAICKPWRIHVGTLHKGHTAYVMIDDTHAAVFINGNLIRHFALDKTRSYQPSRPRHLP